MNARETLLKLMHSDFHVVIPGWSDPRLSTENVRSALASMLNAPPSLPVLPREAVLAHRFPEKTVVIEMDEEAATLAFQELSFSSNLREEHSRADWGTMVMRRAVAALRTSLHPLVSFPFLVIRADAVTLAPPTEPEKT